MSLQQRMSALQRANAIRSARADLKRAMKAKGQLWSRVAAIGAITEPEWTEENWPVRELLVAIPYFGDARVKRIMRRSGVPETKPLGELTDRQRDALIAELGGIVEEEAA